MRVCLATVDAVRGRRLHGRLGEVVARLLAYSHLPLPYIVIYCSSSSDARYFLYKWTCECLTFGGWVSFFFFLCMCLSFFLVFRFFRYFNACVYGFRFFMTRHLTAQAKVAVRIWSRCL